jgi:glutathione S-transferase
MLRIWGRMSSINVRKVVWTVQALGLTHQRTDAGGQFGIVQTPEYLARNPNAWCRCWRMARSRCGNRT